MLYTLYFITLNAWLITLTLSLLSFFIKNNISLPVLRTLTVALAGLTLAMGLTGCITQQTFSSTITVLFIGLHPSLSLNPLSSFFVLLMGLGYLGISLFSFDYFRHFSKMQQQKIHFLETLFAFSILLVFMANDPMTFLLAWEIMAFASYFLVVSIEPNKNSRKAGFLYLTITHIGFFALVIAFFLLFLNLNSALWSFSPINQVLPPTQSMANIIFLLALIGFGAKAALFPLHVWLPEAHPTAPSPISALMSGVMLKTAIYGFIRFTFDFLLSYQQPWWGYSLVGIGLITKLIGVIHAAMQTDMKRLLAYSSMENMGFIFTAFGLSIIFYQYHEFILSDLALIVVLLHSLNHSLFKSLLFLGTGSILHATGERNLGKLGGLIHTMPWVSVCTLIGALSMAGLPFFNGFISEWLYLGIFFHHDPNTQFLLAMFSPLIIALSVLVFGLAGFVIVKFYGVAFLGQPRESALARAYPSRWMERIGLVWLSLLCVLLGLWPNKMISLIQKILQQLLPQLQTAIETKGTSLQFVPNTPLISFHGFNPLLLGVSLLLFCLFIFAILKRLSSPWTLRRVSSWRCGLSDNTARMQDTAEGFGQPFKQIFSHLITVYLQLPNANDAAPHYHSQLTEKIWAWFYIPLTRSITRLATLTKGIQQGRMTAYLLYMGVTLIILLTWVVWS